MYAEPWQYSSASSLSPRPFPRCAILNRSIWPSPPNSNIAKPSSRNGAKKHAAPLATRSGSAARLHKLVSDYESPIANVRGVASGPNQSISPEPTGEPSHSCKPSADAIEENGPRSSLSSPSSGFQRAASIARSSRVRRHQGQLVARLRRRDERAAGAIGGR
jgi:hypothetical protein